VHDRPLAQPAFDDPRIGQQGEVPDVMAGVGQPPDDLGEVRGLDQRHRHDDRATGGPQEQVQRFVYALPPGREVLEVRPQLGGQHPVQAEAEVLGIADHAPGQAGVQLAGSLRFAAAERPVDP
jgi:hypothetical protein